MMFIGDQGWFYLSARDMLLGGPIPLVGITSSHTWLHQGPLWTYLLAIALWIGHFNPISGAYFTASLGLVTVWLVCKIGSKMFSSRIGLLASLLYATSPLTIFFARMPYHTAPIAILTLLLFYTLFRWINGYRYGFPVSIFLLALLYNFETATFMLVPIVGIILLYGVYKRTEWVKPLLDKKIILLSFVSWILPMIPMIMYDINHGYPQTLKFAEWVVYKIATIFGFPKLHPDAPGETYQTMLPFASALIQRMVFLKSEVISWLILGISFVTLVIRNVFSLRKKEFLQSYSLLFLFFTIPTIAYIAEKTNSDAYWIVFFPIIAFMIAVVFDQLMSWRKNYFPMLVILLVYVSYNIFALFQTNFLMMKGMYGYTIHQRLEVAKKIISDSKGKQYTIGSKGPGSQYESITMNYQYLTWWLGHGPSKSQESLQFIIQETPTAILLDKRLVRRKK